MTATVLLRMHQSDPAPLPAVSTPPPDSGPVPSYVHEETVYDEGPTRRDVRLPEPAPADDASGDWDRSLTDRIRQLVEQPGGASAGRDDEPDSLSAIASGSLEDSTAGVDWSFVQSRDSGNTPLGEDDETPVGFPVHLVAVAPDGEAGDAPPDESDDEQVAPAALDTSPALPEGALDTLPDDPAFDTSPSVRRADETRPAPDGNETIAPAAGIHRKAARRDAADRDDSAAADGFGIMRRPKK